MGVRFRDHTEERIADNLDYVSHGLRVEAKTADYTVVVPGDNGKVFTTRGAAGAIIFTLPAITAGSEGFRCWFYNVAGQNMTVQGTAGELVTFNDAGANSVAFSTSSELIGACVMAVSDGTSWLIMVMAEETQTMTVAT